MAFCTGHSKSYSTFTTEGAAKTIPKAKQEAIAAARLPRDAKQVERSDAANPASRQYKRRLVLHGRGYCSSLESESGCQCRCLSRSRGACWEYSEGRTMEGQVYSH